MRADVFLAERFDKLPIRVREPFPCEDPIPTSILRVMAQTFDIDPHTLDRAKLPLTFDATKMQTEYDAMALHPYVYYSVIMMALPDSKTPEATINFPYFRSIIDTFNVHTKVTLARILRLEPGAEVKEHCDPMLGLEIENSVVRFTIPISGQDGVTFYLNQTPVPMKAGECWYLKLSDQHRITHDGPTERVNFTIDVVPNDWVRDLIAKGTA